MSKQFGFYVIMFLLCLHASAQQTVVTGHVFEKGKNESLPFVSVGFKGTTIGMTTDFEGNFKLATSQPVDSLVISFVGYKTVVKKVKQGQSQYFEIALEEQVSVMKEVTIRPKLNPALRIVNKAVKMRNVNDYALLNSYQYDSYNKTDVAMNNISEKMKKNKLLQPLKQLFDTAHQMKNEDGKSILPIFISETQSQYFYNANPSKKPSIVFFGETLGNSLFFPKFFPTK